MKKSTNKKALALIILLVLLVILIFLNIAFGAGSFTFKDFINNINDTKSLSYLIVRYERLPRILACILVGAALSVSGLLLQTMLNNSLAAPGIIGINSGAGLAVVILSLLTSTSSSLSTTIATFIGAFLSAFLIYLLARKTGASRSKLILAGIAISKLFSAAIDTICYISPTALQNKVQFNLGSFAFISTSSLLFAGIIIILGLIGALLISKSLGILILGDDVAQSLGLNVKVTRFLVLLVVALLSAGSVSIAGLLSFLGLIVPHICRKLFGNEDYAKLTGATILVGANLTLLCDLLARTIMLPYDIPVGIIMSIIGVPFFIFLIFYKKGGRRIVKSK